MKREWKEKWVEALRSGQYQQGRGALKRTNGEMCCLGVLCDLVDPDGWLPARGDIIAFKAPETTSYLPDNIYAEVGDLNDCILAGLNDSGDTFAEIADYIETNL